MSHGSPGTNAGSSSHDEHTVARFTCCDERRRIEVRGLTAADAPNGIDFLEVLDSAAPAGLRQRALKLRFVRPLSTPLKAALGLNSIRIEGGGRIRGFKIDSVTLDSGDPSGRTLDVVVDRPGDFSTYTLLLVDDAQGLGPSRDDPPPGVDPALASVDFSFKIECAAVLDCMETPTCPSPGGGGGAPESDFLGRDAEAFRRLMLDRMALLLRDAASSGDAGSQGGVGSRSEFGSDRRGWGEARRRHPGDVAVTVVELLAHVADRLSYRQDAIATEAYLDTARLRRSVRRHARLVDYRMHDGCTPRLWARIRTVRSATPPAAPVILPHGTALATAITAANGGLDERPVLSPEDPALARAAVVFETLHDVELVGGHDEIEFHTWDDERCRLPAGATRATLRGHHPLLREGMFVALVEARSPRSGLPEEADPDHRHIVRLTRVRAFESPAAPLRDPVATARNLERGPGGPRDGEALEEEHVTEIAWSDEDALPFDLHVTPIASENSLDPASAAAGARAPVGVLWGNIVLADCGRTVVSDPSKALIAPPARPRAIPPCDPCAEPDASALPARWSPEVPLTRLVHAVPFPTDADHASSTARSATSAMCFDPVDAVAQLTLLERNDPSAPSLASPVEWRAVPELLSLGPGEQRAVVVEVEHDGRAFLRFGDGVHGRRPTPGATFDVRARVGDATWGAVGLGTLRHIATDISLVVGVENPLPAFGGAGPESVARVRERAPVAFRRQERAVTAADYEARSMSFGDEGGCGCTSVVSAARATFRWTGSWHTVMVAADRAGGMRFDDEAVFRAELRDWLEPWRLAGRDVAIGRPRPVGIQIVLALCTDGARVPSAIAADLLDRFSLGCTRSGAGRGLGFLHPDRFSFGETVEAESFAAAALALDGVASVTLRAFYRATDDAVAAHASLEDGAIHLEPLEIAHFDFVDVRSDPGVPSGRGLLLIAGGDA